MHGYPTKDHDYVCWYPLRRTVIVKCLVQEHNKTSPTALEPRPLDLETSALTMRPQRTTWPKLLKCIWQTFLICSIKAPRCTDKNSEKEFDSDFSSPCFDVPKTSNFSSGGVKTTRPKTGDWMNVKSYQDLKFLGKQIFPKFSYFLINSSLLCHFLANRLAYKKKMTEKSVFR